MPYYEKEMIKKDIACFPQGDIEKNHIKKIRVSALISLVRGKIMSSKT
jgi:hypothetical protein